MLEITFIGSEEQRTEIRDIAKKSRPVPRITEEDGSDGTELIRITLEYGPDVLNLLTSLAVFIEACIKARHAYNITFKNRDSADER